MFSRHCEETAAQSVANNDNVTTSATGDSRGYICHRHQFKTGSEEHPGSSSMTKDGRGSVLSILQGDEAKTATTATRRLRLAVA
jgi:serine/threonine protein phosphatase PrpC